MLVKIRSGVAIALLLGASAVVNAAGLGKLTVSSALGQVLAAEIDLVSLQPGEFESLTARVASPDAYKDAKIEYSSSLRLLRFSVQRRANGQPFLKVTSESPINEPFVDLLVEVTWPAGRLQREYPILLDPPGFAESRSAAPVAAASSPPPTPPVAASAAAPAAPTPSAKGEMAAAKPAAAPEKGTYGPVKKGDTLSKIAGEVKPESVSLEQMLAALYRENKTAFAGNNMNRLKVGQILTVPSAEEAGKVGVREARQEVQAHVADWKAYREQLAGAVAASPAQPPAPQKAAGTVAGAAVAPPPPATTSADVLKVSKTESAKAGAAGAGSQDRVNALQEEVVARDKALKEAQSRVADLEKQVRDLQRLIDLKMGAPSKAAEPKGADVKVAAAKAGEAKAPEPEKAVSPAKGAEAPKAVEAPGVKPAEPAKAADAPKTVEPPKVAKAPAKSPPPPPEPELMDQVMDNLPLLAGGAGAIGLLGLGGFMLARRRKASVEAESVPPAGPASSVIPTDLKPGKGGGESVDTDNSSFLTDFEKTGPSTLDTNEVDPVAEAEVYIAYGRDTQAEEILKDAMGRDSTRHEVSLKLLEIYHARKSATAFETVARQLHDSVGDASAIWHKAAAMGAQIDPGNPLYGGVSPQEVAELSAPAAKPDLDFDLGTSAGGPAETQQVPPVSLDFDLGTAATAEAPVAAAQAEVAKGEKSSFDIDLSGLEFASGTPGEAASAPAAQAGMPDLDLTFPSTPAAKAPSGGLDLGDLNLEAPPAEAAANPMTTKLELAKAYLEIGDKDGAREILEEVAKAGSPAQQDEAQKLIASL